MSVVRRATPEDRNPITGLVAEAFASDPAWAYLLGARYDDLATTFAGASFDMRIGSRHVWVTDDITAVAMWDPPGGTELSPQALTDVWNPLRERAGPTVWQRMDEYGKAVGAVKPVTPYWYLGILATRPDRQGHGLATAVIAPVIASADEGRLDTCLETSTPRNVDFYGRRGFTDSTTVRIPSGPPTWWLRRAPRPEDQGQQDEERP